MSVGESVFLALSLWACQDGPLGPSQSKQDQAPQLREHFQVHNFPHHYELSLKIQYNIFF